MENVKNNTKAYYLENMQIGNNVAFTVESKEGTRMLSGKVVKLNKQSAVVQTKNGSIFFPKHEQIAWVKTGTKWPQGIYNALKYSEKGF